MSADHLDSEERDLLASWLPRLAMTRRLELGQQWLVFAAARLEVAPAIDRAARAPFTGRPRW